ncbi:MAG: hypothetical protein BWY74_03933 [Firmicutes bacterium ADurb.Bin419]|nr:MAG: hypothetical protein BWY74_03933 [Firmicutes bacterium ADurb.Bin419]
MAESKNTVGAIKASYAELHDNIAEKFPDVEKEVRDKIVKSLKEKREERNKKKRESLLERKKRQGFVIIDKNNPIVKMNREGIEQSKEARSRAVETHQQLGDDFQNSTIASDGINTINGWAVNTPEGFTRANPKEINDYSKNTLKYEITKSGGLDYGGIKEEGFDGKRRASDAEKQLIFQKSNEPIGVSREMCPDCVNFFQKEAQYRKTTQVVSEPGGTNIFDANGDKFFLPD